MPWCGVSFGHRIASETGTALAFDSDVFEIQPINSRFFQCINVSACIAKPTQPPTNSSDSMITSSETIAVHICQCHVADSNVSQNWCGRGVCWWAAPMQARETDGGSHPIPVDIVVHNVFDEPTSPTLSFEMCTPWKKSNFGRVSVAMYTQV
jgi:hypothetical protein